MSITLDADIRQVRHLRIWSVFFFSATALFARTLSAAGIARRVEKIVASEAGVVVLIFRALMQVGGKRRLIQ